jgi:hypothetical protein
MKSALRLLVLMAVIVTVAALGGGWKWGSPAPSGAPGSATVSG